MSASQSELDELRAQVQLLSAQMQTLQARQQAAEAIHDIGEVCRFIPRGDYALHKVVALREYDLNDGSLVEIGEETGESDRVKLPTWDWLRIHE